MESSSSLKKVVEVGKVKINCTIAKTELTRRLRLVKNTNGHAKGLFKGPVAELADLSIVEGEPLYVTDTATRANASSGEAVNTCYVASSMTQLTQPSKDEIHKALRVHTEDDPFYVFKTLATNYARQNHFNSWEDYLAVPLVARFILKKTYGNKFVCFASGDHDMTEKSQTILAGNCGGLITVKGDDRLQVGDSVCVDYPFGDMEGADEKLVNEHEKENKCARRMKDGEYVADSKKTLVLRNYDKVVKSVAADWAKLWDVDITSATERAQFKTMMKSTSTLHANSSLLPTVIGTVKAGCSDPGLMFDLRLDASNHQHLINIQM